MNHTYKEEATCQYFSLKVAKEKINFQNDVILNKFNKEVFPNKNKFLKFIWKKWKVYSFNDLN